MNRLDKFVTDWFSDEKSVFDLSLGQFVFAFTSYLWYPFYKLFKLLKQKLSS